MPPCSRCRAWVRIIAQKLCYPELRIAFQVGRSGGMGCKIGGFATFHFSYAASSIRSNLNLYSSNIRSCNAWCWLLTIVWGNAALMLRRSKILSNFSNTSEGRSEGFYEGFRWTCYPNRSCGDSMFWFAVRQGRVYRLKRICYLWMKIVSQGFWSHSTRWPSWWLAF